MTKRENKMPQNPDPSADQQIEITCCRCAKIYLGFDKEQAYGCASDVHIEGIVGHYGSTVADLEIFRYANGNIPAGLKVGAQICDDCIISLRDKGILLPGESRLGRQPTMEASTRGSTTRHYQRATSLDKMSLEDLKEFHDAILDLLQDDE
mgnify:CR=1 FL=1